MRLSVVSADQLVLRYRDITALEASSFTIPEGAITTLIGPNGSGKSTLLSAIAGLLPPAAGTITVTPGRRISYVLQATKVNEALPVTVGEVVAMGRYATTGPYRRLGRGDRQAVRGAMDRMGITALERRHLRELSGGQRQRVFVAQGIAQDHDLLLLDEPLTGLDLVSARAIDTVLHEEQAAGRTIVITSHDLNEAAAGDWVVLLAGRVVASGPPGEVLTVEHLSEAYGSIMIHDGKHFAIEDPAHRPVPGRHEHGSRGTESGSATTP